MINSVVEERHPSKHKLTKKFEATTMSAQSTNSSTLSIHSFNNVPQAASDGIAQKSRVRYGIMDRTRTTTPTAPIAQSSHFLKQSSFSEQYGSIKYLKKTEYKHIVNQLHCLSEKIREITIQRDDSKQVRDHTLDEEQKSRFYQKQLCEMNEKYRNLENKFERTVSSMANQLKQQKKQFDDQLKTTETAIYAEIKSVDYGVDLVDKMSMNGDKNLRNKLNAIDKKYAQQINDLKHRNASVCNEYIRQPTVTMNACKEKEKSALSVFRNYNKQKEEIQRQREEDEVTQKIKNIQVMSFEKDGKKKTMNIWQIWLLFFCVCYAMTRGSGNQPNKTDLHIQQISDPNGMNDLIYHAFDRYQSNEMQRLESETKASCHCRSKKVLATSSQPTTKGQILGFEVLFYIFASFGMTNWFCLLLFGKLLDCMNILFDSSRFGNASESNYLGRGCYDIVSENISDQ